MTIENINLTGLTAESRAVAIRINDVVEQTPDETRATDDYQRMKTQFQEVANLLDMTPDSPLKKRGVFFCGLANQLNEQEDEVKVETLSKDDLPSLACQIKAAYQSLIDLALELLPDEEDRLGWLNVFGNDGSDPTDMLRQEELNDNVSIRFQHILNGGWSGNGFAEQQN